MGWDIYFFNTKGITREKILENNKYKEKNIEGEKEPPIYITYIDEDGKEDESALYLQFNENGEIDYGSISYGMNVRPLCWELYHDFGVVATEDDILYFGREIDEWRETHEITDEEESLMWDMEVWREACCWGFIDDAPTEWAAKILFKIPEYIKMVQKYGFDISGMNIFRPSLESLEEYDRTYYKRHFWEFTNKLKLKFIQVKYKIKDIFTNLKRKINGKEPLNEDDLPF